MSNSEIDIDESVLHDIELQADSAGGEFTYAGQPAFDESTIWSWIFPTNQSKRDYQFNIVREALLENTLVCLPTGLGKTFIAAVVIYNFYRWFPSLKIVFCAPNKPLVEQQVKACQSITGIPCCDLAHLYGQVARSSREKLWSSRRVFFCTPQTFKNDLLRHYVTPDQVVLIVFDEAHRGTGDYDYTKIVRITSQYNPYARILALTATPGSDPNQIQEVITNLCISKMIVKSENDYDVRPYSHRKNWTKRVVKKGTFVNDLMNDLDNIIKPYMDDLVRSGACFSSSLDRLTKGSLFQMKESFDQKSASDPRGLRHPDYFRVESLFGLLFALVDARMLLECHGIESFKGKMLTLGDDINNKRASQLKIALTQSRSYCSLMKKLDVIPTHPKLQELHSVLEEFHRPSGAANESVRRCIVFTNYRNSVDEIVNSLLSRKCPWIRPVQFIGQSSGGKDHKGLTQREQQVILCHFRDGIYNTLVSTCIGEEGLDIAVDLVICYDVVKSALRTIQRIGRTGRRSEGSVMFLVCDGKEEKDYGTMTGNQTKLFKSLSTRSTTYTYCRSLPLFPRNPAPQLSELTIQPFRQSQIDGPDAVGKRRRGCPRDDDDAESLSCVFSSEVDSPLLKKQRRVEPGCRTIDSLFSALSAAVPGASQKNSTAGASLVEGEGIDIKDDEKAPDSTICLPESQDSREIIILPRPVLVKKEESTASLSALPASSVPRKRDPVPREKDPKGRDRGRKAFSTPSVFALGVPGNFGYSPQSILRELFPMDPLPNICRFQDQQSPTPLVAPPESGQRLREPVPDPVRWNSVPPIAVLLVEEPKSIAHDLSPMAFTSAVPTATPVASPAPVCESPPFVANPIASASPPVSPDPPSRFRIEVRDTLYDDELEDIEFFDDPTPIPAPAASPASSCLASIPSASAAPPVAPHSHEASRFHPLLIDLESDLVTPVPLRNNPSFDSPSHNFDLVLVSDDDSAFKESLPAAAVASPLQARPVVPPAHTPAPAASPATEPQLIVAPPLIATTSNRGPDPLVPPPAILSCREVLLRNMNCPCCYHRFESPSALVAHMEEVILYAKRTISESGSHRVPSMPKGVSLQGLTEAAALSIDSAANPRMLTPPPPIMAARLPQSPLGVSSASPSPMVQKKFLPLFPSPSRPLSTTALSPPVPTAPAPSSARNPNAGFQVDSSSAVAFHSPPPKAPLPFSAAGSPQLLTQVFSATSPQPPHRPLVNLKRKAAPVRRIVDAKRRSGEMKSKYLSLLDLEAEISGNDSGDELSQQCIVHGGSINDGFIDDTEYTQQRPPVDLFGSPGGVTAATPRPSTCRVCGGVSTSFRCTVCDQYQLCTHCVKQGFHREHELDFMQSVPVSTGSRSR